MNTPRFLSSAKLETLQARAALLRQVRVFFDDCGFFEVETPILSQDIVVDRHLDPISVPYSDPHGGSSRQMWLQTSPEFAMKRLLASGAKAIYQICHVFRAAEQGSLHNPEFTMVEWYRVGDDMEASIRLLSELAKALLDRGESEVVTYATAFRDATGLDAHRCEKNELIDLARQKGLNPPESMFSDDRDTWLDYVLSELVQPHLGKVSPAILCDYPATQAALARTVTRISDTMGSDTMGSVEVAERFELYVDGIELANGYHELLDADVLRERNRSANQKRIAAGMRPLPEESHLLAAMDRGLPACAGVALGFDRLVMIATNSRSIEEVIPFPFDRA
ncbi:MAG: lysyl-tRNA synthetase class 2 [Pirellulaceae bacterium]|jgi:lysyl-tRNA synthetase class 2